MARNTVKIRKHETGRSITTKTPYGTTSDMLVKDEEILSKVAVPDGFLLVSDDRGYYFASKNALDNGLADPVRYSESVRDSMNFQIMEQMNVEKTNMAESA